MNVPTYLVAQNIHGPRFTTPLYMSLKFRKMLPKFATNCIIKKYEEHQHFLNEVLNKVSSRGGLVVERSLHKKRDYAPVDQVLVTTLNSKISRINEIALALLDLTRSLFKNK